MPEDERRSHHVIADPPVLEVVHVRAADADGADLEEHLSRPGIRDRALLDAHVARRVQHGGDVGTHESAPDAGDSRRGGRLDVCDAFRRDGGAPGSNQGGKVGERTRIAYEVEEDANAVGMCLSHRVGQQTAV